MLIILGYIIICGSVFGGFAMAGGHLAALVQPIEMLMIGGAAIGAFIAGNNSKILIGSLKGVGGLFKSNPYNKDFYRDLLSLLFVIINKIKRDGILSIEGDINDPYTSPLFEKYPTITKDHHLVEFIQDYLRLMVTGTADFFQIENLMDNEIETHGNEEHEVIHAVNKMADGMPAFGIVAAVMGVVHTMENADLPPAELGALVAKALVGTFLGILLGYGFIGPLAVLLEQRHASTTKVFHCVKVVLLATINSYAPSIAIEFGRKILFSTEKPTNAFVEEMLKELKANKS